MRIFDRKFKEENHYQVGIISFNINTFISNFGAALHSFALQKYLDKIGVSNVIIDWRQFKYHHYLKPKKANLKYLFLWPSLIYKRIVTRNFFKRNCTITNNTYFKWEIKNLNNIEQFCCDTDITWTPINKQYIRAFMCDYKNMKDKDNIAYSVDTGSKYLSKRHQKELKKYSKNFKYISLRNIFKIDHIKEVLGKDDIVITIDPTLLLDEVDYLPVTKIPKLKNYVLVYNCQENNKDMIRQAKKFAKQQNLKIKIINCYPKRSDNLFTDIPTPIGIESFLGFVKNCDYLFTNSYHGICFAAIFKKNFFAYTRKANNDKIATILNILGLNDRQINSTTNMSTEPIDYEKVYKNMDELRNFSKQWIFNSVRPEYANAAETLVPVENNL